MENSEKDIFLELALFFVQFYKMTVYMHYLTFLLIFSCTVGLDAEKYKLDKIWEQNEIVKNAPTSSLDIRKICSAIYQVKALYEIVDSFEMVKTGNGDVNESNVGFRHDINTLENGCTVAFQNMNGKNSGSVAEQPGLILHSQSGLTNIEEETLRDFEGIFTASLPSLAILINFGLDGQSHLLFAVEEVTRLQSLCDKDEIYDVFKVSMDD